MDIIVERGGQIPPLKKQYDTFDSKIYLIKNGVVIKEIQNVNTDFYNGYNGGILAEGNYAYICGIRKDKGNKCLFLFNKQYMYKVKKLSQLTESMRIFPSLIPNPNHVGNKIITQVLVHFDGMNGGYSHGCITIYPENWNEFIDSFNIDDTGILSLIRHKDFIPPPYYA